MNANLKLKKFTLLYLFSIVIFIINNLTYYYYFLKRLFSKKKIIIYFLYKFINNKNLNIFLIWSKVTKINYKINYQKSPWLFSLSVVLELGKVHNVSESLSISE